MHVAGRKEIITFFYIYMLLTMCSLLVDAGVVPSGSGPFAYFVAAQNGLANALFTCLVINGFVGFQLYEDGTILSVWLLRVASAVMFIVSFVVSLLTFKGQGGLDPSHTMGMFIVLYIFNPICIFVYLVMQLLLVLNTLEDRWPLGNIFSGLAVFIIGQVLMYVWSDDICNHVQHYLDGLFFATLCNLFAVMMIYKVCHKQVNTTALDGETNFFFFFLLFSTGTLSPRRISNSLWVSGPIHGKSRILPMKNCLRRRYPADFTFTNNDSAYIL